MLPKEWVGYHKDECFGENKSTQDWTMAEVSCVMQWAGGRIHGLTSAVHHKVQSVPLNSMNESEPQPAVGSTVQIHCSFIHTRIHT